MNFDSLMSKTYNKSSYNCAHFVCDVFDYLGMREARKSLEGYICSNRIAHRGVLRRLSSPVGICLVLFQAPCSISHVGVYIDGKILHLTESGVSYTSIDVASIGYNKMRFYNVKNNNR